MRSLAKTRLAGASAAILALSLCSGAGTSWAQSSGQVINDQVQLGDVFSTQVLNVEEAPEGLGASATAVGNIVAATGQAARLDFQSSQEVAQHVEAATNVVATGAVAPYFQAEASATGNSATAGTCCALTLGSSMQTISADSVIGADATGIARKDAASISVDATAVGNTQGWNQINGEIQAWTQQTNEGLTAATAGGNYQGSPGNAGLSATAIANNVTVDAENATLDIGVEQARRGAGAIAVVDARFESAADVEGAATATGNLVDIASSGPEAATNISQLSETGLDASTNLQLTQWSGDANAVAYGVGNSVVFANAGPSMGMLVEQTSDGDINTTASFTGGTGKSVFASSTAMGNAISGYACSECGGDFGANGRQVNNSRVASKSNVVVTGRAGLIAAQSTAVGNSATYQVFSNGGE